MKKKLTPHHKRLITALRTNSRTKLRTLAKNLNTPLTSTHDRLYELKKRNIIRLVSLIDYNKLNYAIHAWIFIQTKQPKQLIKTLKTDRRVNTIYHTHNNADIACEAIFETYNDYNTFLEEIPGEARGHPVLEVLEQAHLSILS